MEDKLSFALNLSLNDIAVRRAVVNLWIASDILTSIVNTVFDSMKYNESLIASSETIEDKVRGKVSKLVLPELLKQQMRQIIRPIGSEIRKWKMFHEDYLYDSPKQFNVSILKKLCWTSSGAIDYPGTAKEFIRCKMLGIIQCYKLACLYCLEDNIRDLWEKLPEKAKNYFYQFDENRLHFCWPYILKGEESELTNWVRKSKRNDSITFPQHAFNYFAMNGNKAATEYFLQKLTREEIAASLIPTAFDVISMREILPIGLNSDSLPYEKVSEVLCYLLSLMSPEQQLETLRRAPSLCLSYFLDWPVKDNFLKVAKLIWTFLPATEISYMNILRNLEDNFTSQDYYFPKSFQEFFIQSPSEFQKQLLDRECKRSFFFREFFKAQDKETVRVIFRNVDVEDRLRLVSSNGFFTIFCSQIKENKWDMVELCLREAELSKEDKGRVKEAFKVFLHIKPDKNQGSVKTRWKRFFQMLDKMDASATFKRNPDEETQDKTKKLCRRDE